MSETCLCSRDTFFCKDVEVLKEAYVSLRFFLVGPHLYQHSIEKKQLG